MPMIGTLESQLQHADHRVHGGADLMTHGRQECAFRAIGLIGTVLGAAQVIEQLAAFADINPAADDALDLTDRIAVRQDPVIDRQVLPMNMQGAIQDQRLAFGDYPQIVGMVLTGLCFVFQVDLHDTLADDVLALDAEDLQVTVIAGL